MSDFKFVDDGMQKYVDDSKKGMAELFKIPVEEIECKGFRIFLLHEESGMASASGLFNDDYDPDDED
jgi:hypothetical protein